MYFLFILDDKDLIIRPILTLNANLRVQDHYLSLARIVCKVCYTTFNNDDNDLFSKTN